MLASHSSPISKSRRRRSLLRSHSVKLAEAYDEDDEGLIRRSPPLERQSVRLEPSLSPEYIPPPESPERSSRLPNSKRRRPRAQASQGDAVLIGFMGGLNYPDLALRAGEETLPQSDDSDVDVDIDDAGRDEDDPPNEDGIDLGNLAKSAVNFVGSNHGRIEDSNGISNRESTRPARPKIDTHTALPDSTKTSQLESSDHAHSDRHATKPTLATASKPTRSSRSPSRSMSSGKDSDSVATSPLLRKFTIPSSERGPTETLPAMQTSPPSNSSKSPNAQHKLPSLSQIQLEPALLDAKSPNEHLHGINRSPYPMNNGTVNSPPIGSIATRPGQYPSPRTRLMNGFQHYPYGQPSPASSDASPRDSNMSPPDKPLSQAFYFNGRTPRSEELTPQSAHSQESGSSFSTAPSPHHMEGRPILPPLAGLPNGPMMTGSFKCDHAGCTAAPFQTQYLLK